MAAFQEFAEDLPLLVESGLIAIKQGDEESAKKLFNAIGVIDPQNTARKMGYGLIGLHKMDLKVAKKNFEEILSVEKDNWRAHAFLAFAHVLSVMDDGTADDKKKALQKAAEIAQDVLKNSQEQSTRELAQSLLDWERQLSEKMETEKGPAK